ncbi:MAG: hypothetical protein NHB32_08435 [Fischerella sp. CENA71]|nr:hypothetical protein [Fischerella sp. CENA71]
MNLQQFSEQHNISHAKVEQLCTNLFGNIPECLDEHQQQQLLDALTTPPEQHAITPSNQPEVTHLSTMGYTDAETIIARVLINSTTRIKRMIDKQYEDLAQYASQQHYKFGQRMMQDFLASEKEFNNKTKEELPEDPDGILSPEQFAQMKADLEKLLADL